MEGTWKHWSTRFFGHVAKMTPENEEAVALFKIQEHINEGYSDREIALIWNQGHSGQCSAGVNKHGVEYDSCAYTKKVLAQL